MASSETANVAVNLVDAVHTSEGSESLSSINFASEQHGAKPLSELCAVKGFIWNIFSPSSERCGGAYSALQENSQCWTFRGSRAQVGIRLSNWTSIRRVGIDSGRTVEESPRKVLVWGMIEDAKSYLAIPEEIRDNLFSHILPHQAPSLRDYHFIPLAAFVYDLGGSAHQEFTVLPEMELLTELVFGVVVFQFLGNWGGPSTSICQIQLGSV